MSKLGSCDSSKLSELHGKLLRGRQPKTTTQVIPAQIQLDQGSFHYSIEVAFFRIIIMERLC